jgi:hypothetical protein
VPLQNSKEFVIALMKDKELAVQQYLQSYKVNLKKIADLQKLLITITV